MIYFLTFPNTETLEVFKSNGLPATFKNMDYYEGFAAGYFFGKETLYTADQLCKLLRQEKRMRDLNEFFKDLHIIPIQIFDKTEDIERD